jgi:hypothetical protein
VQVWKRGDIVALNGELAVVVGIEGDPDVPEDHIAVWFGGTRVEPNRVQDTGRKSPEIWAVPAEYFVNALPAVLKH